MPVYDLTYRAFEGEARRRFRWWTVMTQEMGLLMQLRPLKLLMWLPTMHILLRLIQFVVYDGIASNPSSPLYLAMRTASIMTVDSRALYDFLRFQSFFVFLIMLLAGSGMLCNDIRHNLIEVYFSKPLTWLDYLLGKISTLVGMGLLLTAVPGVFLVLLHNLMAPSLRTLQDTWWWPIAIVGFSLTIILPYALIALASSALFWSERFAGLAMVAVIAADWFFAYVLAEILRNRHVLLVSLPTSITRLGEVMLVRRDSPMNLPWVPALLIVVAVCVVCLVVVVRQARRAEGGQ